MCWPACACVRHWGVQRALCLGLGGALALCADTAAAVLGVPRNAEGQLVTLALSAGICALCAVLWQLCRKKLPVVFGAGE